MGYQVQDLADYAEVAQSRVVEELDYGLEADAQRQFAAAYAGEDLYAECREGICGTCEVGMVSGKAEHRDLVMSEKEKRENNSLMTCVSRGACGSKLVLDI